MDWSHWRRAAEKGVLCAINPDAHRTDQFVFVRAGTFQARKGWLTADQVLNTKPLAELQSWLRR
jgi:DNA polymerase (family 10)